MRMNHRGHREHREKEREKNGSVERAEFDSKRMVVSGSHGQDEPDELTYAVIGAAIEVHRILGPGFLEAVYEDAICIELSDRGITFDRQTPVPILYKGRSIGDHRLDLLIERRLVVELKAVDALQRIHTAQVISYLKATKLHTGLLINFNSDVLRDGIKRISL